MTKVVLSGPRYGISPAFFGGFCDDTVVYLKWQIRFCLESCQGLETKIIQVMYRSGFLGIHTAFMGRRPATLGSVKTPTSTEIVNGSNTIGAGYYYTFRAFMFLRSIPTSAVTPSPNRKLDAATYVTSSRCKSVYKLGNSETRLKRIFLLNELNGGRKTPQLIDGLQLTMPGM